MNLILYPIMVMLLWSILVVLIKDSIITSTYGMGIALISGTIFIFILLTLQLKVNFLFSISQAAFVYLFCIGLTRYILGLGFYYKSIQLGDISISAPIIASKPIFVGFISSLFKMELLSNQLIASVIFATLGFFVLTLDIRNISFLDKRRYCRSILLALCTSLCWSIGDILVKKIDYIPSILVTFWSLSIAAFIYYVFIIVLGKSKNVINMLLSDKKRYLLLGILSLGLAYLLLNISIIKVGIVRTNTILVLWPVISSFIGFRRYKENLNFTRVVGMLMLVVCFIISVIK